MVVETTPIMRTLMTLPKNLLVSVLQFVGLCAELFDKNGIRIDYKDLWINSVLHGT